jgi:hypothetical protein
VLNDFASEQGIFDNLEKGNINIAHSIGFQCKIADA